MSSENMLAAYKAMKKGGVKNTKQTQQQVKRDEQIITGDVDFLNEQVFGKYMPSEDESQKQVWSPENAIKTLERGFTNEQLENSKLPDYLKESFRNNPSIDVSSAKMAMQEVEDKMNERMGGFAASRKIMESLDANDKKSGLEKAYTRPVEQPAYQQQTTVDYSLIKQIVEEAVSKKIGALRKSLLTEGISGGEKRGISLMADTGESFMFVDTDNNVFECKMVYKGQRKKK